MLVQMDGCDPSAACRRVLLVGATNRPEVRHTGDPLIFLSSLSAAFGKCHIIA